MADIKSFPFPIMSDESLDFLNSGGEYTTELSLYEDENKVVIGHELKGENIVSHLLKGSKAKFACIVVLPSTMYRRIHPSESSSTNCNQNIDLSESGCYQKMNQDLLMFRPVVLTKEKIEKKVDGNDGLLSEFWEGQSISIPKGSIIAYGPWKRIGGRLGSLLHVKYDPDLGEGEMRVEDALTNNFQFFVHVGGEKLYHNLRSSSKKHSRSVLTHALSVGFEILKEKYKHEDSWQNHLNLRFVKEMLEDKELMHWSDDDFKSELAATKLFPHIFEDENELDCDD